MQALHFSWIQCNFALAFNTKFTQMKKRRSLLMTLLLLLGMASAHAQELRVTGVVRAANTGETLPGATVVEKGTKNAVATNFDGRFEIRVKQGAILVVSSLGMQTREVAAQPNMVIDLQPQTQQLKEVVVSALGIERERKAVGYSVEEVSGNAVSASGEANMVSGLSAKAAGIQVINSSGAAGASSYIRVRGQSTFTQNDNQPLFVVDGVPINNSQLLTQDLRAGVALSNRAIDINPDDIESVTVLKGGAAAALYGTRGANGVILITTKKGAFNRPFQIEYSGSVEILEVNKLPKLQNEYAQGFGGQLRLFGQSNSQFSWGPRISDLGFLPNGQLTDVDSLMVPGSKGTAKAYDPYEFFQRGSRINNSVSLSGGNDRTSYALSIANLTENGVIPLNTFQRTTVRLSGGARVSNSLKVSASANYANSGGRRIQQGSNTSGLMLGLLRTPPSYDNSNGVKDPTDEKAFLNPDGTQRRYFTGYDNPYWTINRNPFFDNVNRLQGNVQIDYVPVEWLSVMWRLGTDFYQDRRTQIIARQSRTAVNGRLLEDNYKYHEWNSDLIVTARYNYERLKTQYLVGWNLNQRLLDNVFVQGDNLAVEEFYNLSNASTIIASQGIDRRRIAGIFGEVQLSWDDQHFITLTARGDQASTFGDVSTVIFYPSASYSWLFSETLGLNEGLLSRGKFRASWARVGLEPAFGSNRTYYSRASSLSGWIDGIQFPFRGATGFTLGNTAGNPALGPEFTTTTEFGLDLGFFDNKLNLDVTWYDKLSTDLIVAVPVASSSGFNQLFQNIGRMRNRGWEISANYRIFENNNWGVDLGAVYTWYRNKVLELAPGVDVINLPWGFFGANQRLMVGEAYGTLFGDDWQRDADGNVLVDANGYPIYSPTEVKVGDPNPDWLLGITGGVTYKNWTLNMVWDIRRGGDIWNGTRGALYYFGTHADVGGDRNGTIVFNDVVKGNSGVYAPGTIINGEDVSGKPNTTPIPNNHLSYAFGPLSGFTGASRPFIEDGSWVRLRQLTIGYTLPNKVFEGSKFIKGLSINFTGRNLLLFTKYTGIDPETNLSGATNSQGADYFNMPNTRGYILGVRANF
jgi:TonB-linked SusC/RagA family outer membrane protein